MLNKRAVMSSVSLGLAILTTTASAQVMGTARIEVEGPENRVYEFHQNLKTAVAAYLVNSDFGTAGVACSFANRTKECGTLDQNDEDVVTAEYFTFSGHEYMTAFLVSWQKLQARDASIVSIKFGMSEESQDCSTATQPCVAAWQCVAQNPRRCDKAQGPPCTSCN